ncbi:cytochrome c [Erwinia sp. JUb26]|uniref:c-type cytochrome n=1 Tax=Erwinia sp. JUb26 TaxID=2485126 RepID=UPI000F9CFA37|nr:cytochrome c [Erwinia sp. JUb26]ROR14732.1 cytochrome c553 [Erwinia sp. JUb26]
MKKNHRRVLTWMFLLGITISAAPQALAIPQGTDDMSQTLAQPEQASRCMSCHGPGGISQNPEWPNLAGQKAPYLRSQLNAFRDGSRKNGMMQNVVTGLTDNDTRQLSQYFSQLPPANP